MDRGVEFKIVARYLEAFSVKESLVRRGVCMCEGWREEGGGRVCM